LGIKRKLLIHSSLRFDGMKKRKEKGEGERRRRKEKGEGEGEGEEEKMRVWKRVGVRRKENRVLAFTRIFCGRVLTQK